MAEVTDIILPGNEDSFTVGKRIRIPTVSDLDPFHRRLIEGPYHPHRGNLRL